MDATLSKRPKSQDKNLISYQLSVISYQLSVISYQFTEKTPHTPHPIPFLIFDFQKYVDY
ncbi:MAG: hypothetical protein EWV58_13650 [Microcystis aeruginosa Ma_MB_F_20061100_S19]|nr:MAG: hypothetical protein EWV59_23280 [Microcystis aeruginosa Ma_MB_F_20061100_S19D]TRU13784.1 MAG: hypothetical protein EWV58_13650 [Microcystis aeruginosa Ma_MB_F_20061100_S19]